MALTHIDFNDPAVKKIFAEQIMMDAIHETFYKDFIGSVISLENQTFKSKGDTYRYYLSVNLTGVGETEGEATDGNEEEMLHFTDEMKVNELWKAVKFDADGTIGAQRITWSQAKVALENTRKWHTVSNEIGLMNQVAGNTATTISGTPVDGRVYTGSNLIKATGLNPAIAPSATRIVRAGGAATDQLLTPADTFTLGLIDAAREIAYNSIPVIKPIEDGSAMGARYVCFISPEQYTDLRRDNSSPVQWLDLQIAQLQGGADYKKSAIASSKYGYGMYNDTLLVCSTRVPYAVNSVSNAPIPTARRAVFMGADAVKAFLNKDGGRINQNDLLNGGREIQINVGGVSGLKKVQFNNVDYGTIVISTYAAAHTS